MRITNPVRARWLTLLALLIMSAFAGCATMSDENVARSHDQCLEAGGNFISKAVACEVAIHSNKYQGASLAQLYDMLGVHQQEDNRHYDAINTFNRAIKIDPTDPSIYQHRGQSEQAIGNEADAQQDFSLAQSLEAQRSHVPPAYGQPPVVLAHQYPEEERRRGEREMGLPPQAVSANPPPGSSGATGGPALSAGETRAVIAWIAKRVASDRQPYCYRESYGRTAGTPLSACRPGEEKNGALCYPQCRPGYSGAGPVCWQDCPRGFKDIGVSCAKPPAYGRGAGYPWKFGDPTNDRNMFKRCERDHGRGNCEKFGLIVYPKCKPGFHAFGSNICTPTCRNGMRDDGAFCAKGSYGRGAGRPMVCASGLQQNGALCYPVCRPGFYGVGPVCWQRCPSGKTACGAGCASSTGQCVENTVNMVVAPATLAMNIMTGSPAAGQLLARYRNVKKAMEVSEKVNKINDARAVANDTRDSIELWVNEYVGSFGDMTSPEVVRQINRHFANPKARRWIEEQYALSHLSLMLKNDLGQTAQNVLDEVSTVDPIGVTGVISAFAQPICSPDTPFPQVHPYY